MRTTALALLLVTAPALAAPPAPRIDAGRISADIEELSSDAYEGRGPDTAGEVKTIAYVTRRMQAAGLAPAGDPLPGGGRAWTQDVPLLKAAIRGTPALSLDVAGRAMPLVQGQQIAVRAPLTGAKSVALRAVPLVFVGYGVTAPEKGWDDFKDVDVRGKIVVLLVNDPDYEAGVAGGAGDFGGRAMTYYGRWTYKYEEAARRGAAGVMIVHETGPAAYGWATVRNSNTNTMFDIVRADPAASHTPFESWIQRDLAVALFKASGLDFEAEKRRAATRGFRPVPLKATLTAAYAVDAATITSHNIAGRLAGTRHPDETLIYSAHWDHLGIGPADARGDTIYNGAVDNASGTAALLEMARAFAAAPRTERSVLFLSVTAEEKGLLGSEYYATHPLYPLATTVGAINMDGISTVGPARDFTISGSAHLTLLDQLVAEGAKVGRAYAPEAHPEAGHFYRSDHFSLAKAGVPAISFGAGTDLVTGGKARGEALAQEYVRLRYHQPADEWRADWDLSGAVQDLTLLYALGTGLANGRDWPEWGADSEFRAVRDRTASARR